MPKSSHHTIEITGFSFLLMIFFIQACGVFQTRKAQPPQSGDGSKFVQPDQPDIVITNLQNAIKSMNTQNYLRCFSDSTFTFTPTVAAQQSNPGLWDNWGKAQEQIYFDNLSQAAQNLTGDQLQLSNVSKEIQSSEVEQYTADYTLTVIHNRSSQGVPTVANGKLLFIVEQNTFGLWYITKWTDLVNTSFTWSDMKATFVKG